MKKVCFTWLFFTTIFSATAQVKNMLHLKSKKNHTERTIFVKDSTPYFLCELCYDDPKSNDEEFCKSISFEVKDTAWFRNQSTVRIPADTAFVGFTYNRLAVINQNKIAKAMTGTIRIISVSDTEIKLDLDITVVERETYIYKGTRTFRRKESAL